MRWPVTADSRMSIRTAITRIDRSESRGIVVVDDTDRLVGTVTLGQLRSHLRTGGVPDDSVSSIVNETPTVIDSNGTTRPPDGTAESDTTGTDPDVMPVIDENNRVIDVRAQNPPDRDTHTRSRLSNGVETVLVVGGAGYLGSVLCRKLLEDGFDVRILDPVLYGAAGIADLVNTDRCSIIDGDARSVETVRTALEGVDAVVHLGGIVGDPASEIDPEKTLEYNLHSTQLLASLCKYRGINRFVFASTCSVYGRSDADAERLSEDAPQNPVSLYARLKIQSERVLTELADGHFAPTILRMATIYGQSPRMRFDLVGNILPAKAYHERTIPVFGGDQYRPNVHVDDAARAYVECLKAPIDAVAEEVVNVGSNQQNYRIDELATVVADCFPAASIEYHDDQADERSYRVEFEKLQTKLGFEPERSIRDHCLELRRAFEAGRYSDYTRPRYNNYKTLVQASSYEKTEAAFESTESEPHERPTVEFSPNEIS